MQTEQSDDIQINTTTKSDFNDILWLFERAMELQGKNGYKVWDNIDKDGLQKDIENGLQYKIVKGKDIPSPVVRVSTQLLSPHLGFVA